MLLKCHCKGREAAMEAGSCRAVTEASGATERGELWRPVGMIPAPSHLCLPGIGLPPGQLRTCGLNLFLMYRFHPDRGKTSRLEALSLPYESRAMKISYMRAGPRKIFV